jgi:hypothetical protein
MVYRIGKTTFATKQAKEAWILEGILRDIEYVEKTHNYYLNFSAKELIKISKRKLKTLIKSKTQ